MALQLRRTFRKRILHLIDRFEHPLSDNESDELEPFSPSTPSPPYHRHTHSHDAPPAYHELFSIVPSPPTSPSPTDPSPLQNWGFPLLPLSIQRTIYTYLLPGPRIIEIYQSSSSSSKQHSHPFPQYTTNHPPPLLLHINQLSRSLFLSHYSPLSFGHPLSTQLPPYGYISYPNDTIFLSSGTLYPSSSSASTQKHQTPISPYYLVKDMKNSPYLSSILRVAIEFETWLILIKGRKWLGALLRMKALQEIIIVFDPPYSQSPSLSIPPSFVITSPTSPHQNSNPSTPFPFLPSPSSSPTEINQNLNLSHTSSRTSYQSIPPYSLDPSPLNFASLASASEEQEIQNQFNIESANKNHFWGEGSWKKILPKICFRRKVGRSVGDEMGWVDCEEWEGEGGFSSQN